MSRAAAGCISAIALAASCTPGADRSAQDAIVFTNVNVVDVASGDVVADRNVVVDGGRIVAEGPALSTPVPAGARTIDGRGRFLIPGLWDMHVHLTAPGGDRLLMLYIANGVTGVRDMASEWPLVRTWRDEIARGERVGPRIVTSGPYLEGGDISIPHLLVRTPADAQPAVDSLLRLGVDFVKVHGQLTRETYFAIARAARSRNVAFAGHVPRSVLPGEASDSGQRSIEHLLSVPNPCTPAESVALAPRFPVQAALGRCTSADLEPLFARFVRNGTWIVPTLVAAVEIAGWPSRDLPGDAYAAFLPDTLRLYVADIFPMPDSVPPGADVTGRALLARRAAVVAMMHRAGVGIMAGTDAPLRNSPPGFGLHEELAWLVRAGLSPAEALRAATLAPARFLESADSFGSVARGSVADLVLLEANPLDDIRNTRRIVAVVANGRLFTVRREGEAIYVDGTPLPVWPERR